MLGTNVFDQTVVIRLNSG